MRINPITGDLCLAFRKGEQLGVELFLARVGEGSGFEFLMSISGVNFFAYFAGCLRSLVFFIALVVNKIVKI